MFELEHRRTGTQVGQEAPLHAFLLEDPRYLSLVRAWFDGIARESAS